MVSMVKSLFHPTRRDARNLLMVVLELAIAFFAAGLVLQQFVVGETATGTAFLYLSAVVFGLAIAAALRFLTLRGREKHGLQRPS